MISQARVDGAHANLFADHAVRLMNSQLRRDPHPVCIDGSQVQRLRVGPDLRGALRR